MRACLFALGMLLAGSVVAQEVTLEPSAAQRCLTPVAEQRGTPAYPVGPLKSNEPGYVFVELKFTAPDKAPAVSVLAHSGSDDFVDAVRAHVASFRVPCLDAAVAPVRLVIEFVFEPDNGAVQWSEPSDASERDRLKLVKCVQHVSGDRAPAYPVDARRRELQARVLARLRFSAPDGPPEVEVFARPGMKPLSESIRAWVAGYRMPCYDGMPLEAMWTFIFRLEGSLYGFKPMQLLDFLPHVRGIQQQKLAMDFNTMGCPFDVKLHYRMPLLPNAVGEVGAVRASRRPLITWLTSIELDMPKRALDSVFGDTVTLTVPCTKINLKPQGETQ